MAKRRLAKVACIVGARPNFVKMAPILAAFDQHGGFKPLLIHTGQHYDVAMNEIFFRQLGLPEPDMNLEVGSGTHTSQTARIMLGLEEAFLRERPDLVLVVGDVNSTVAAALVAAKLRIPVAHVEAGLRSFDREMPEEINRVVTDRLSDILFTTERRAGEQLISEGIAPSSIHFVGNVMIDTLFSNLDKAIPLTASLKDRDFSEANAAQIAERFALVTLHRPSNVDDVEQLSALLTVLAGLSDRIPVVFSMHPRTEMKLETMGLDIGTKNRSLHLVSPFSYFEMIGAMRGASLVVTDSGGLQEETTALGIPCLTVRDNTERPITITEGTNKLVGSSPIALAAALDVALDASPTDHKVPEYWDGHAAVRIAAAVDRFLQARL